MFIRLNPSDSWLFTIISWGSVLCVSLAVPLKYLFWHKNSTIWMQSGMSAPFIGWKNTGWVDFFTKKLNNIQYCSCKQVNFTVNSSITVESPCLKEACKVPSALEIAVTSYSPLVGMFYRPTENIPPSPDSMLCLWVLVFSFRRLANADYIFQLLVGIYLYKIIQLKLSYML